MPNRVDAPLSLAAAVVVLLAVLVIPGSTPWSGPVVVSLTASHGIHVVDLVVVALGLALASAVLVRAVPQSVVARVPRSSAVARVRRPGAATV